MKRLFSSLLIAVAAAVLAHPLSAQDRTGTIELTAFGGGYLGGTLHAGSNALFARDVSIGTAPTYGVRLGYNFSRVAEIEFGWSQARPEISGTGGDVLFGQGAKLGEMTSNVFEGDFVFNLGRGRVIPYLAVGAGAMTFRASTAATETSTDTRFVANVGAGLKIFVSPQFAFRVDGRYRGAYISGSSGTWNGVGGCSGCTYTWGANWYRSGEITGGLTVALGK
jgi:hypothetical protein